MHFHATITSMQHALWSGSKWMRHAPFANTISSNDSSYKFEHTRKLLSSSFALILYRIVTVEYHKINSSKHVTDNHHFGAWCAAFSSCLQLSFFVEAFSWWIDQPVKFRLAKRDLLLVASYIVYDVTIGVPKICTMILVFVNSFFYAFIWSA